MRRCIAGLVERASDETPARVLDRGRSGGEALVAVFAESRVELGRAAARVRGAVVPPEQEALYGASLAFHAEVSDELLEHVSG